MDLAADLRLSQQILPLSEVEASRTSLVALPRCVHHEVEGLEEPIDCLLFKFVFLI